MFPRLEGSVGKNIPDKGTVCARALWLGGSMWQLPVVKTDDYIKYNASTANLELFPGYYEQSHI